MKTKKRIFFLCLLAIFLIPFFSCSNDGNGARGESLVSEYGYKLNQTINEKEYHRVMKYGCVDNGDNTFEVKALSIHYFATANPSYKDLSGSQLCSIVKNGTRTPDDHKEYTLSSDKENKITNSSTGEVKFFYLYAGLKYTVYYYY